jgi:hypothetical protein
MYWLPGGSITCDVSPQPLQAVILAAKRNMLHNPAAGAHIIMLITQSPTNRTTSASAAAAAKQPFIAPHTA